MTIGLFVTSAVAALFALPAAATQSSFQFQGAGFPHAASEDGGLVVLSQGDDTVLWSATGPVLPLDSPDVDNIAINGMSADGSTVVGQAAFTASGSTAFRAARWSVQGGWQYLGDTLQTASGVVAATRGVAYDASRDGSFIVGGARLNSGQLRPFLWSEATGMVELDGGPGFARAISDDGETIAGQADGVTSIWNASGEIVHSFPTPPGSFSNFRAASLSSGGDYLVGPGSTVGGTVWNAVTGAVDVGDFNACCPVTDPLGYTGLGNGGSVLAVSSSGRLALGLWAWEPPLVGFERFATVWTPGGGVRRLDDELVSTGADIGDFQFDLTHLMSSDGAVVIGVAFNSVTAENGWFTARLDQEIGRPFCPGAFLNSTGTAGQLSAQGAAVLGEMNLTLEASSLPSNVFGYAISSMDAVSTGIIMSGNLPRLCLTGTIGRHQEAIQTSGASGSFSVPIDLTALPRPSGQSVAAIVGQTWAFQVWHRDAPSAPVGFSNMTQGVSVLIE